MDILSPPHHHQQPPQLTTPPPPPPPPTTTTSPTATNLDLDPRIQPTIPKQALTNGVLKRHKPRHRHNLPPPVVISYKECLKNHAASMGGQAVDGCGEFMPSPTSTPTDPTSLKCAACGCHRNFHRRDPDELFHNMPYPSPQHVIEYQPHHRHHPPPPPPPPQPISIGGVRGSSLSPADSPSPPPISSSYYPSAPHMLLALSSAPPENTLTLTHTHTHNNALISGVIGSNSNGKKRFRTKFSQYQKQKMHELAEQVGWKIQKKDEDKIIGFCNQIGVEKGVFKVWMHNNKMTLGNKKDSGNDNGSSGGGGGGIDFLTNHQHQHQHQPPHLNDSVSSGGGGGVDGNVIGTNGSSSSS